MESDCVSCPLNVKPNHCFQGKRMSTAVSNLYPKSAKNEAAWSASDPGRELGRKGRLIWYILQDPERLLHVQ